MTDSAPGSPGVAAFARAWTKAITGTCYVPLTVAEVEQYLGGLTERLAAALRQEPFSPGIGHDIGTELVAADFTAAEALGRTIEVMQLRLLRDLGATTPEDADRIGRLLGSLATGYAKAIRDRTLDEQETIRQAALVARVQAEQALRASEARFRHQATHDPLTGLPNRALFAHRLAEALGGDGGGQVGICFIDLDGFKVINDSLGHGVGDRLLVAIASRLGQQVASHRHLVARMGGDEFVILVTDPTDTDELIAIADEVLVSIAEPVHIDGHELAVTASIGIAQSPAAGANPTDLMRAADITLQWAKAAGKGRWALFDPARDDLEIARYALSAQMPAALEHGEFVVEYQPMVSLFEGTLVGVEALVRWRHPKLGRLQPGEFIPLAEETGLILRLGYAVLEEACEQAARWWPEPKPEGFISVNLAVRQVHDPALVTKVFDVLDRTGLDPARLQLEITESSIMGTDTEPIAALRELAARGIRIAIDDFGTGYSNLAYLRRLPVRELKIAGEFVTGLRATDAAGNPTDERILATLVSLAHTLGLTVTAEGVETTAQAERLRAIGCDAAQGWLYGRPGSAGAIGDLVGAGSGLA
ncbi:bifunctional diguanylate cyclase/phosphodiesterase [Luedemannella helvata]|uniref:EAL domain-containing protein n=1 Tax=Luedemannella helvata TaxID=349315 RepID=A0ABP4WV38_9ACTN